jgi:hypothetical protein
VMCVCAQVRSCRLDNVPRKNRRWHVDVSWPLLLTSVSRPRHQHDARAAVVRVRACVCRSVTHTVSSPFSSSHHHHHRSLLWIRHMLSWATEGQHTLTLQAAAEAMCTRLRRRDRDCSSSAVLAVPRAQLKREEGGQFTTGAQCTFSVDTDCVTADFLARKSGHTQQHLTRRPATHPHTSEAGQMKSYRREVRSNVRRTGATACKCTRVRPIVGSGHARHVPRDLVRLLRPIPDLLP